MKINQITLFLLVVLISLSTAQFGENILTVDFLSSQENIVRGEEFNLALILNIKPGLHINSNNPTGEFYIPTVVTFDPRDNMSFGQPEFPQAEYKLFSFSDEKIAVFENRVIIFVPVSTSPNLHIGPQTITAKVSYQGCNDNVCFAPEEQKVELLLNVVEQGTAVNLTYQDVFSNQKTSELSKEIDSVNLTADEKAALEYLQRGLLYAVFAFFVIGLALNLTPCVYPVIPITVSYFGGQSNKSRGSAFVNALFYQIGIAIAFAILGLVSGLAGKQWGFLFQSPWFVVVISTIILLMAASLFGSFEITIPSWLLTRVGKTKQGTIGSLIMGLTVGVVIAPCAAGIIIGLVGLVAKLGLVVKGTLLFFVMGLGLGLPYLILATFSGLLDRLPQSGVWMLWIRKVFAFMLIGVALYFLIPQLERIVNKLGFLVGITAIIAGLLLGFLEHSQGFAKKFIIFKRIFGFILLLLGLFWINNAIHAKKSTIEWIYFQNQSVEKLLEAEKPIFIDFYADWCAPCKQLDRETFTDKNVMEMAKSLTMLKVDCTAPDEKIKEFMERHNVTGMPTLLFISKKGVELDELRGIGFIPSEKMVTNFEKLLQAE